MTRIRYVLAIQRLGRNINNTVPLLRLRQRRVSLSCAVVAPKPRYLPPSLTAPNIHKLVAVAEIARVCLQVDAYRPRGRC